MKIVKLILSALAVVGAWVVLSAVFPTTHHTALTIPVIQYSLSYLFFICAGVAAVSMGWVSFKH